MRKAHLTHSLIAALALAAALVVTPLAALAQTRPAITEQEAKQLARDLAKMARELERELGSLGRDLGIDLPRDLGREIERTLSRDLGREAAKIDRDVAREAAKVGRELSRELGQVAGEVAREASRAARSSAGVAAAARVGAGIGRDMARSARSLSREMAHYYEQRQGPEHTERYSRGFKVGANGVLDLANISGDIVLTVEAGNEISIEAVKRVRSTDAAIAKQALAEVQIEAVERAGRVEIRTVYPRHEERRQRHSGVSVDFTVRLPVGASASLKSVSGDVRASGVKGDLRVESVSGEVTCDGNAQLSLAKSVSGDVLVTGVATDADVRISSISGSVTVKGLRARGADVGSISGEVQLWDVNVSRATVKTISGGVEYTGTLAKGGRYEMSAHSGDVRLAISDAVGFELDASSFSGTVRSDLPVTTRSTSSRTGRERRTLRGTYGDGSAFLDLSSFSGDVTVVKR